MDHPVWCTLLCAEQHGTGSKLALDIKAHFENVLEQLMMLKRRLDEQGSQLKEFYVDNCCSWRKKLQQVFGPHLLVYLDIFHAVKRVTEKISKRHTLRSPCIQELKMVFRDRTDVGPERTKPTPNAEVLTNNLDKFTQ